MKLFKVRLTSVYGHQWTERIDARSEKDVKDAIYARYGLLVNVLAVA